MRLKRIAALLLVAVAFPGVSDTASAHVGDRVFAIPEITDDMLSSISLADGTVDEWPMLFGAPTLTVLDFSLFPLPGDAEYDPSDLAFEIWMGWHGASDRLYVAAQFVDNLYRNELGAPQVDLFQECDSMALLIDGDHSGGKFHYYSGETGVDNHQAQWYEAIPEMSGGTNVSLLWTSISKSGIPLADWMVQAPYSDGGGSVVGENPTLWTVEFYVTPFDDMVPGAEGESVVSDMEAGREIGFDIRLFDWDDSEHRPQALYFLTPYDPDKRLAGADHFTDAVLVESPDNIGTGVSADSWARIKASLGD